MNWRQNGALASSLVLIGTGASFQPKAAYPEKSLLDRMQAYYQSQFDNLEMLKQGKFGVGRVEMSSINAHGREGGDPGYDAPGYVTLVAIYGNHGAKLDPVKLSQRYHRFGGPGTSAITARPDEVKVDALLSRAASEAGKGKFGPFSIHSNGWLVELRPIFLSKPECVECHKPLKKGDAVALMMYSVHPRPPASQR